LIGHPHSNPCVHSVPLYENKTTDANIVMLCTAKTAPTDAG